MQQVGQLHVQTPSSTTNSPLCDVARAQHSGKDALIVAYPCTALVPSVRGLMLMHDWLFHHTNSPRDAVTIPDAITSRSTPAVWEKTRSYLYKRVS